MFFVWSSNIFREMKKKTKLNCKNGDIFLTELSWVLYVTIWWVRSIFIVLKKIFSSTVETNKKNIKIVTQPNDYPLALLFQLWTWISKNCYDWHQIVPKNCWRLNCVKLKNGWNLKRIMLKAEQKKISASIRWCGFETPHFILSTWYS